MEALKAEPAHRRLEVRAQEDVGALRRDVAALAAGSAVRPADAALAVSELATNLVLHTSAGGYVLYRRMAAGIELIAVDRGPGLPGVRRPGPRLGVGLGTVRRLSSTFDLYSSQPAGTVVLARLSARLPCNRWCRWSAVNVPQGDGPASGDAWAVAGDGRLGALLVDGLGHGPEAALAAQAAVSAFGEGAAADVEGFLHRAHEAMRTTRGGVLAVAVLDPVAGEVRYAGVGNIAARLLVGGRSSALGGRAGTLGTQLAAPHVHVQPCPWAPGATLIMASDGLRSAWDPSPYPGLLAHDPAVVAATLQRDFGRPGDDATVLVVQDVRPPEGG